MLQTQNHQTNKRRTRKTLVMLFAVILLVQCMISSVFAAVTVETAGNAGSLMSAGGYHCMALKPDGTVVAWGRNHVDQCDVPTGLTDVVAIAGGGLHSMALKSDGTVVVWGDSDCDVPTGLTDVVAIAGGTYHCMALKSDGNVAAWGYNSSGQCDVPTGLTDVVAIAAGGHYSMALKADGTVVAWGAEGYDNCGQCDVPSDLGDVVAISAGYQHAMALKSNGTIVAWGRNIYGQCNVPSGLGDVVAIAAGRHHSMALNADGTVAAWGWNDDDQCDVPTGLGDVVAIAGATYHCMALKSDGTVVAWGGNDYGQRIVPSGLNLIRYLDNILIDNGAWPFDFDPDTLSYTLEVNNAVDSIGISPFANDDIQIEVQGDTKASGSTTDVSLNVGQNTIIIDAVDRRNTGLMHTYIITVNRATPDNANLDKLATGTGILSPAFDTDTVAYSVQTADAINSIDITAATVEPHAELTIGGKTAQSGTPVTVSLDNGANLIPIIVTAPDGATQKSYIISVNGTVSDAGLKSLSVSGHSLGETFAPDTTAYTVDVGNSASTINLTAETSDSKALMLIDGAIVDSGDSASIPIGEGENVAKIMVVAQDASTKTYTLTVTREETLTITTDSLPLGIIGAAYSETLAATGGSGGYTWSVTGLPDGFSLSTGGVLSGTPKTGGRYSIKLTVTDDAHSNTVTKTLTLTIKKGCGNGAYVYESDGDSAYTGSYSSDGLLQLTVNSGVKGLTYFRANISTVTGHVGNESCVFIHIRNGVQIGFSFNEADYDTVHISGAAFNVQPGDVIEVYVVDALSNNAGESPVVL